MAAAVEHPGTPKKAPDRWSDRWNLPKTMEETPYIYVEVGKMDTYATIRLDEDSHISRWFYFDVTGHHTQEGQRRPIEITNSNYSFILDFYIYPDEINRRTGKQAWNPIVNIGKNILLHPHFHSLDKKGFNMKNPQKISNLKKINFTYSHRGLIMDWFEKKLSNPGQIIEPIPIAMDLEPNRCKCGKKKAQPATGDLLS